MALAKRDSIIDKLHEEASAIVRSRLTPPPTGNRGPRRQRRFKKLRLRKGLKIKPGRVETASTLVPPYPDTTTIGFNNATLEVNLGSGPSELFPVTDNTAPFADYPAAENERPAKRPIKARYKTKRNQAN